MLLASKYQALLPGVAGRSVESTVVVPRSHRCRSNPDHSRAQLIPIPVPDPPKISPDEPVAFPEPALIPAKNSQSIDSLYLFACHLEWEKREDTTAAWELVAAAQSGETNTRAHARALLASSHHIANMGASGGSKRMCQRNKKKPAPEGTEMNVPYGIEIVENCTECTNATPKYFCGFSMSGLHSLDLVSHKTTVPAGAVLFVEGQVPRGMFIICEGRVNLSTTSKDGKILILKTAYAGEAVGLSAVVSGLGFETTAVTATPCQLCFIGRNHVLGLMETHNEIGLQAARCLSRDFRSAHRDIHDLVLTRSSRGKLARLLLTEFAEDETDPDAPMHAPMTHEEMAQRIGSSRETVTRLLTTMRKKRLIRLEGSTVVIRDRSALEDLAV